MGLKSSTPPPVLKNSVFYRMSGFALTAKAYKKEAMKYMKEQRQMLAAFQDQGVDPGYTLEDKVDGYLDKLLNDDFRMQCKIMHKMLRIAEEEGIVRPRERETPKLLDDSPTLGDRYALITIRPEPGTCLVFFEQRIADFMERPWVLGAEYHFEQVGEDEATMGDGFHVHIVAKCKKSIRVPEIEQDATHDLEPIRFSIQIGERKTEKCPKPRKFLKTERDLQWALNYIRGDKHNEDKEDAVALNDTWRRLNGLQDAYYVGVWDNRESRPDAVIIEEVL